MFNLYNPVYGHWKIYKEEGMQSLKEVLTTSPGNLSYEWWLHNNKPGHETARPCM